MYYAPEDIEYTQAGPRLTKAALDREVLLYRRSVEKLVVRLSIRTPRLLWGFTHEDLVQEGMLALVAAGTRFDPTRGLPLFSYAYRMVQFQIKQLVSMAGVIRLPKMKVHRPKNQQAARNAILCPKLQDVSPCPKSEEGFRWVMLRDQFERVWQCLQKLTPLCRKALDEYYFRGLSIKERAQLNGTVPALEAGRLTLARRLLRKQLKKDGVTCN